MERQQTRRVELRGKLLHFRPLIDQRLLQWEQHYKDQDIALRQSIAEVEHKQSTLQIDDRRLNEKKVETQGLHRKLQETQHRQTVLETEFALIPTRSVLQDNLALERNALERQTALVQNASSRGVDTIRREIHTVERERDQLQRELGTLTDNLFLALKSILPPGRLDTLNRVLSQQSMTLAAADFSLDPIALKTWMDNAQDTPSPILELPGMKLHVHGLSAQHMQRSQQEISLRLGELAQQVENLEQQMTAARDIDSARRKRTDSTSPCVTARRRSCALMNCRNSSARKRHVPKRFPASRLNCHCWRRNLPILSSRQKICGNWSVAYWSRRSQMV